MSTTSTPPSKLLLQGATRLQHPYPPARQLTASIVRLDRNSGMDLAGRALDWILDHLPEFDPYPDDGEIDILRAKAAAELALMCVACLRVPQLASDQRLSRFVEAMSEVIRRPIYNERIVGNPGEFTLIGGTYAALRACGLEDVGHHLATERVPYRMLDLRYILELGGFRHDIPSYSELYTATPLAAELKVAFIGVPEAYSITHSIFFMTRFGAGPPNSIPDDDLPRVRWLVAMLLGIYSRERQWDLVGELLTCCHFLDWYPPLIFDEGWMAFWASQRLDGAVPGPHFSEERLEGLGKPEQPAYLFKHLYHTTLVAAMVGSLTVPTAKAKR